MTTTSNIRRIDINALRDLLDRKAELEQRIEAVKQQIADSVGIKRGDIREVANLSNGSVRKMRVARTHVHILNDDTIQVGFSGLGIKRDGTESSMTVNGMELFEIAADSPSVVAAWNTDALYTEHGQRFGAMLVGTTVYFHDIDRRIWGSFEIDDPLDILDARDLRAHVMSAYNTGTTSYQCDEPFRQQCADLARTAPSLAH